MTPISNGVGVTVKNIQTQVYNALGPAVFTDLDLSAVIGTGPSLVFLKFVTNGAAANSAIALRTNGDVDDIQRDSHVQGSRDHRGVFYVLACFTDNNGVIEWLASATPIYTVDVIGWINL